MSGIGQEYLESVCEVKTMTNSLLTMGYISEIDNELDYIRVQNKEEDLMTIAYDTLVKISVFNSKLGFKVLVGRVFLSNPKFIKIVQVTSLVDYERRAFFRVPVTIPAEIHEIAYSDGHKGLGKLILKCDIKDISLNGMFIKTENYFEIGRKYIVTFELPESSTMNLILRISRHEKNELKSGYGCRLEDVSERQGDIIYKYIFRKQSEIIRKMRAKEM